MFDTFLKYEIFKEFQALRVEGFFNPDARLIGLHIHEDGTYVQRGTIQGHKNLLWGNESLTLYIRRANQERNAECVCPMRR